MSYQIGGGLPVLWRSKNLDPAPLLSDTLPPVCGQTPDLEYQLILIFSLFLFCFVLFNGLSLAFFVCPMSICSLCHGCGAFLAWCHPFPSCLPLLPAGSPWVVWAAYLSLIHISEPTRH